MIFRTPRTLQATFDEVARIRQDLQLTLWSLVVLLTPFYVFPSGLPQPADVISFLLLLVLARRWNGRLPWTVAQPLRYLIAFVAYIVVVDLAWSLSTLRFSLDAHDGFLLSPTYSIFNGLMFLTFLLMFQLYGERLLWLTARLVLA